MFNHSANGVIKKGRRPLSLDTQPGSRVSQQSSGFHRQHAHNRAPRPRRLYNATTVAEAVEEEKAQFVTISHDKRKHKKK